MLVGALVLRIFLSLPPLHWPCLLVGFTKGSKMAEIVPDSHMHATLSRTRPESWNSFIHSEILLGNAVCTFLDVGDNVNQADGFWPHWILFESSIAVWHIPKLSVIRQLTFVISQFLWVRNLAMAWLGDSPKAVIKISAGAAGGTCFLLICVLLASGHP